MMEVLMNWMVVVGITTTLFAVYLLLTCVIGWILNSIHYLRDIARIKLRYHPKENVCTRNEYWYKTTSNTWIVWPAKIKVWHHVMLNLLIHKFQLTIYLFGSYSLIEIDIHILNVELSIHICNTDSLIIINRSTFVNDCYKLQRLKV